jgi:hypothetical protein
MEMSKDHFYYNLSRQERELERFFMISSLIKSRIKMDCDFEGIDFDEDVNIYIANLLLEFANPRYREEVKKYVSVNDADIVKLVDSSQDNYFRYHVYKLNADNLLVNIGIFQNPWGAEGRLHTKDKSFFIQRAKVYYETAASYNKKIYRKETAVGCVLDKLSRYLDKYVKILENTKQDYFSLISRQKKKSEFAKFLEEMKKFEDIILFRQKQDEFLDAYSRWKKNKTKKNAKTLQKLSQEVSIIDPDYSPRRSDKK